MINGLCSFIRSVLFGVQLAEARGHRLKWCKFLKQNQWTADGRHGEFRVSFLPVHQYVVWRYLPITGRARVIRTGLYFVEAMELVNRLSRLHQLRIYWGFNNVICNRKIYCVQKTNALKIL